MTEKDKCTGVVSVVLRYFSRHVVQARTIVGALSIGFLIAVSSVSYIFIIQAKTGCLTYFIKK